MIENLDQLRALYGEPVGEDGERTGLAVIGMGKLGGGELNYSSDIDLIFVYGEDGQTAGGESGSVPNGEYFGDGAKDDAETRCHVPEVRPRNKGQRHGVIEASGAQDDRAPSGRTANDRHGIG